VLPGAKQWVLLFQFIFISGLSMKVGYQIQVTCSGKIYVGRVEGLCHIISIEEIAQKGVK
jgi:hypothetical protein